MDTQRSALWYRWAAVALVLALLLCGQALLPAAARAQATETDSIQVIDSTVSPDFPDTITFSLTAESSGADISEIELLYGAQRSESLVIVPTRFRSGQRVEAEHVLDTQIYHLPVGVDLTYRWIIRDAAGNEVETPPQAFIYHDDRFLWQERSDQGVTVYWYEGGDAFGDELIATATRALGRLQEKIGATVEDPVKIYIYANTVDMRGALESNEVEWVGGQASPALGLIIGAVAPGDTDEVRRIIPHELSHQVLYQALDNPYRALPLWFDEGLAVYNQETKESVFGLMVDEAARTDQLVPLEALAASFPADPERAYLSYAQSFGVMSHIIDTYGDDSVEQLVEAFDTPMTVDAAIPAVLDMTVDELDAEWRATLPPAEVSAELSGSPATAPANRFDGAPVGPDGSSLRDGTESASDGASAEALPPSVADESDGPPPSLMPGLALPVWAELLVFATICMGGIAMTGVVLFLVLRLAGVGRR